MAAGFEISGESAPATTIDGVHQSSPKAPKGNASNESENFNFANFDDKKGSESVTKSEIEPNLKLNPLAKEFFPSSNSPTVATVRTGDKLNSLAPAFYINSPVDSIEEQDPTHSRTRNNYNQKNTVAWQTQLPN